MNVLDIYFSPTNFYTKLKEKPQWLIPMIILIVSAIIMTIVVLTTFSPEQRLAQLRERNLPPEQMERAEKMMQGPIPLISAIIAAVVFTPVVLLIVALLFNFMLPLVGTAGTYLTTFSCIVGAALVRVPAMIVRIILILIKGTPFVHTSLILFFPFLAKNTVIYRFISKIDFFTIWELILIAFGLEMIYSIKGKKSYYLVFGVWLVYIIVTSFFAGRGA